MSDTFLSVRDLTVSYTQHKQKNVAVKNVSLDIKKGECLALVGESGCGKSTIALSIIGLLPRKESEIVAGEINFEGSNLLSKSEEEWRQVRGRRIAMVFQDPFSSLNPVLTIRFQLEETAGGQNLADLLTQVQLKDTDRILRSYPHQLSGGQRQRIMIAMALSQNPDFLIADEPTTALDVTVQDEIIKLLKSIQTMRRMSMLFVTHNLGLVKNVADRIAVMRNGEILEEGPVQSLLTNPKQPYTNGLLRCMPTLQKRNGPRPTLEGLI